MSHFYNFKFFDGSVIIVTNTLRLGGAAKSLTNIISGFNKMDIRPLVLTYDKVTPANYNDEKFYWKSAKLDYNSTNIDLIDRIRKRFFWIIFLRKTLKEVNPKIILSFVSDINIDTYIASLGLNCYKIASERGNPEELSAFRKWLYFNVLKRYDVVVFNSPNASLIYNNKYKLKSHAVLNGLRDYELSKNFSFNNLSLVTLSKLTKQKNVDFIIKSFAIINNRFNSSKLTIIGDGIEKEELIALTKLYEISDKVVFKGMVRHPIEELKSHAVFLYASSFEGMPNSIMEAVATSLPVVTTNFNYGLENLVIDSVNGYITNRLESEYADAIIEIITNHEKRLRFAKNSYKIAKSLKVEKTQNSWNKILLNGLNSSKISQS
jgi:glycosyltransferase involved in cell wall biosynthesis